MSALSETRDGTLLADESVAPTGSVPPAESIASAESVASAEASLASSAAAQRFLSELLQRVPPDEPLEASSILSRHPALRRHKSVVLDLALEDYCRRTDRGEAVRPSEFAGRFPEYRSAVERLLAVQSFFEHGPGLAAPVQWPVAGEWFLDYTLREEIGRGAFARVFLANEASVANRTVVVKICRHHLTEAGTQGRLQHPHIVPVLSVSRDEPSGLSAICMPYVGVATLEDVSDAAFAASDSPGRAADVWRDVCERHGWAVWPPADSRQPGQPHPFRGRYVDTVLRIGEALAGALAHTHGRGVCHGDIKPSNVLVAFDGRPMLLDFNLAREAQRPSVAVAGTLPYMSPEQLSHLAADEGRGARGEGRELPEVGPPSDIYSLGATLFQLLTGRFPFDVPETRTDQAAAAAELLAQQRSGPPSLRKLNPRIDRRVQRLIGACLAHRPEDRPSAAELQRQFAAALTVFGRIGRSYRTRRLWWSAGVAAGFFAFAIPTVVISARGDRPDGDRTEFAAVTVAPRYDGAIVEPAGADPLGTNPPLAAEAVYQRGVDLLRAGKIEAALIEFEHADSLAQDGRFPAAQAYCVGLIGLDFQSAAELAERAEAEGFESAANRNNLAYFHEKNGQFDEAMAAARSAIDRNGRIQAAHHNLVRIALRLLIRRSLLKADERQRLLEEATFAVNDAIKVGPPSGALWLDAARIRVHAMRAAMFAGDMEAVAAHRRDAAEATIEAVRHGFSAEELAEVLQILSELPNTPRFRAALNDRPQGLSKEPQLLADPTAEPL